jgi:hypothetical protein
LEGDEEKIFRKVVEKKTSERYIGFPGEKAGIP